MKLNPDTWSGPVYRLIRLLYATFRLRIEQPELAEKVFAGNDRFILALWHDEMFALPAFSRLGGNFVGMVSASRDGELLSRVLERLGVRTVRGSSHRRGLKALLGAVRILQNECAAVCVTVDGPTGPAHQIKDGIFLLAQKSGAKILPVRIRPRPCIKLNTWDRFQLPLPFSKVTVSVGEPRTFAPETLTDAAIAEARARLAADMEAL